VLGGLQALARGVLRRNHIRAVGGFNDRIRSIRVFGRGQLIVYSDGPFGGSERWINSNVSDLRYEGWDNQISSARMSWGNGSQYDRNYERRPQGTSGNYQGQPGYRGDRNFGPMTREQAHARSQRFACVFEN